METWTPALARECVNAFDSLDGETQRDLLEQLNRRFPPALYRDHRARLTRAVENLEHIRAELDTARIEYPRVIDASTVAASPDDLRGYGVVFTAGGEGERLRLSLLERGVPPEDLHDFTKATYRLPGFSQALGALHVNLHVVRYLAHQSGAPVPAVVTTGPRGSVTERVVRHLVDRLDAQSFPPVRVLEQDERLHLTGEGRIALVVRDGAPVVATNPDETGGPLMKMKAPGVDGRSAIEWLASFGCAKVLVLQATALYDPTLVLRMAAAGKNHDGVGVGILRERFPAGDPYGTFVTVDRGGARRTVIVEPQWRSEAMRALQSPDRRWFLPYNTGFYVFDTEILRRNDLPDYATSPKEIAPGMARAPKVGYAATDILPLAKDPAVLAVGGDSFAVLKSAEDLDILGAVARRFGLDRICAGVDSETGRI